MTATPIAPTLVWSAMDDEYLQNIVNLVSDQVGKKNIKAFWLAGHSHGGMTSNRLVRTDYFETRLDGWLSLSEGRLWPTPPIPPVSSPRSMGARRKEHQRVVVARSLLVRNIFEAGEHELGDQSDASPWATKLGCGARARTPDVTDTKEGYVFDSTRQTPAPTPGTDCPGRAPRRCIEYPKCKDGQETRSPRINKTREANVIMT